MEISEILQYLESNTGVFPRYAINEAIARKDEITPALLQILEDARRDISQLAEDENYMAHIYAMFLLAQFREKKAYPLLVNFFSLPGEIALEATGDVVTEDLGRILASVCGGDTGLMEQLAENQEANEFVRNAALRGMATLVVGGVKTREEILGYYKQLFQGKLEENCSQVWRGLVGCSTDLYPAEVLEDIQHAFENNVVDEFFMNYDWVESRMESGKTQVLADLQTNRHYQFIGNVVEEIGRWACFASPKKVGRNEPCPCGSRKKYKKCCGA